MCIRDRLTYSVNKNLDLNILGEMKSQAISQQIDHQTDFFGIEKRWWILANNTTIPIQKSKQVSFGIDFNKNNWLMTLETYYKKVTGINSSSQGFQNQYQYTVSYTHLDVYKRQPFQIPNLILLKS